MHKATLLFSPPIAPLGLQRQLALYRPWRLGGVLVKTDYLLHVVCNLD